MSNRDEALVLSTSLNSPTTSYAVTCEAFNALRNTQMDTSLISRQNNILMIYKMRLIKAAAHHKPQRNQYERYLYSKKINEVYNSDTSVRHSFVAEVRHLTLRPTQ